MSELPTDDAWYAPGQKAAQARLALLIQLQVARTRRLADVTACLADPPFRTTTVPDDIAMLRSHQTALEQIIGLIERQRADTQTLLANLARSHLPHRRPVSRFHRFLAWCWGH
jgi:16S rRNA G966 N2-methylase RsmD